MNRIFPLTLAGLALSTMAGCAICCTPYFDDYPTYGGAVQRNHPEWGRVGSVFSDPNLAATGPSSDSNLKDYEASESEQKRRDLPMEIREELPRPILEGPIEGVPEPSPQNEGANTDVSRNPRDPTNREPVFSPFVSPDQTPASRGGQLRSPRNLYR